MAGKPLTDAQCKEALEILADHDGNQVRTARALGLGTSAFQHRLRAAEQRFPDLYTAAVSGRPRKTPRTLAEDTTHHQHRETEKAQAAKLKDAIKLIAELAQRNKDLEHAIGGSRKPAEWTLPHHATKRREHMPYLLTSDFQIGEVVKAEETEAGYGYDSQIFRTRYRRMIDTTIYLSFDHAGASWTYPGIIYARGGDTISGGIHEELRDTDDLTPIEAIECAFEEESAGIEKLAEAFGRVDVKAPGSAGNHDRTTMKPRSKGTTAHSYDRTINYMLRHHFRKDKRVTFQVSDSFDVRFPIYNLNILLTHGDRMGSAGGTGFIGPLATIMRGAQKTLMEQAALGFKVDRIDHGHFHTSAYLRWVLSNGSMPGYSEYAKSFRMRPEPPTQMLLYHHHRLGVVDVKPIVLA